MCSNQGSSLCTDAPFIAFEASILSHEARKWPMDTWIPHGYRTYQGFSFSAPKKDSCMHRPIMEPYITYVKILPFHNH